MVKSTKGKQNGEEKKRQRSTEKEKRRNLDINKAFDSLQSQLPPCVPKGNRLPKIKTLRLALKYIEHLNAILKGDQILPSSMEDPRPLLIEDFASVALREIQVRNTYSARIGELENQPDNSSFSSPSGSILSRSSSSEDVNSHELSRQRFSPYGYLPYRQQSSFDNRFPSEHLQSVQFWHH